MYRDLSDSPDLFVPLCEGLNGLDAWCAMEGVLGQELMVGRIHGADIVRLATRMEHWGDKNDELSELIAEIKACNSLMVIMVPYGRLVVIGSNFWSEVDPVYNQLRRWQQAGGEVNYAIGTLKTRVTA